MLVNQFAKTFLTQLNGGALNNFRRSGISYIGIDKGVIKQGLPLNALWKYVYDCLVLTNDTGSQANKWFVSLLYQIKVGKYKMYDVYNDEPRVYCDVGLDENDTRCKINCTLMTFGALSNKNGDELAMDIGLLVTGKVDSDRTYKIKYELIVSSYEA